MIVRPNTIFWEQEKSVNTSRALTMINNTNVFTISGAPIYIVALVSLCITANDATASTLTWQSNPTVGGSASISGATASLALQAAGSLIALNTTTLATAPDVGVQILTPTANRVLVPVGNLTTVIAVGSTTGTWKHYLRYVGLSPDSFVIATS